MCRDIWSFIKIFYHNNDVLLLGLLVFFLMVLAFYLYQKKIEPSKKNIEPGSVFKRWVVPLPFFHFHHEPYRRESSHRNFIGRYELSRKLLAILRNSQSSSGSYLITGYRGVGKTSFVKKVLEDYKNGQAEVNSSIRYSRLYDMYLWLMKLYGRYSLKHHIRVYKAEAEKNNLKRSFSRLKKYLSLFVKPLNKKYRFISLFLVFVIFICVKLPSENTEVYFGLFIFSLILLKLFDKFGVSIFSPKQWKRWLFNPVLLLQINLGHERLDTKQLLFDIVSLLKLRYREGLGFLSWKYVNVVMLLVLSSFLTQFVYRIWGDDLAYIEAEIQNSIFTIYKLEPSVKRNFSPKSFGCESKEACVTLKKWVEKTEKKEYEISTDTIYPVQEKKIGGDNGSFFTSDMHVSVKNNKKSWSNLKNIYGETYLSRAEFEKALASVIGEEAKDRHILKLLSFGDISNTYKGSKAADFCEKIRTTFNDNDNDNDNDTSLIYKSDASYAQHAYCSVNKILQDAYYWAWKGYPLQTKEKNKKIPSEKNSELPNRAFWVKEEEKEDDKSLCESFYCGSWMSYTRQFLLDNIFFLEPPNGIIKRKKDKDNKEKTVNRIINKEIKDKDKDKDKTVNEIINKEIKDKAPRPFGLIVFFLSIFFAYFLYRFLFSLGPGRVIKQLEYMHKRIIASADNIEVGSGVFMSMFSIRKNQKFYPLDSRQAEFLLLGILETNHRLWPFIPHPEFIFIFDELDKIDPTNDESQQLKDVQGDDLLASSPGDSIRLRKYEVEQLLSNLKNIITVAPSRFIFIAGRDMMDANLADQGEVNHLYSSLFDETLYIPSFLTDHSDKEAEDISSMVEQYVCRRLLPKSIAYYLYSEKKKSFNNTTVNNEQEIEYKCWSLEIYLTYLKNLDENKENDWEELASFLLDFIYYLTYRSAGSPKKLSLQFEEFVRPTPENLLIESEDFYFSHPPIISDTRFVLKFNEREQYQIQMISHIFILLHGETSHLIRQYGDKLSLSTFSILDYIFKYHSIAFSARDLERMPDVLDIHRAPALPQIIDVLLNRMLTPYLQRLENGVYEYHFLQHFQREIIYISQFSERDLAAFNFTLDESINIKQHFRNLLKRQMRFQKGFYEGIIGSAKASETWHTLPSLYVILGDISTLDKDYSDALTEYRNALQYLEPAIKVFNQPHDQKENDANDRNKRESPDKGNTPYWCYPSNKPVYKLSTSMNQLMLYIQILLKIGLLAERRNQFDNASAHYFHAYRIIDHVLKSRLGRRYIIPNFSLLPLLYQPYICLAYIHVKYDLLTDSAESFMNRAYEKFERYLTDSIKFGNTEDIHATSVEPSIYQQTYFLSKIKINSAELLVQQSRFEKAGRRYLEVIESILFVIFNKEDKFVAKENIFKDISRVIMDRENISTNKSNTFTLLAKVLSGLGDISCGLCLKEFYQTDTYTLSLPSEQDWRRCKVCGCFSNNKIKNIHSIKDKGLYFYLMSAEIYKINNCTAEASLSLWKIQNVLSYGFSFSFLNPSITAFNSNQKDDCKWLFGKELGNLAESAFEASYATHLKRLKEIGVKAYKSKDWIAPPLKQTAMVLAKFWNDEITDYELKQMGAFPIHTRVLAGYLKALSYYQMLPDKEDADLDLNTKENISKMFYILVQSAEDGSAYEGGIDLLTPHLGAIYFLLWKILIKYRKEDKGKVPRDYTKEAFKEYTKEDTEFTGEKRRFLSDVYCGTRAYRLLSEITGRHTKNDAFTRYINRQYYLHGAFSDSYAQGVWSIDYAICPVVELMKSELREKMKLQ